MAKLEKGFPSLHGFRMPPEWSKHSATWMSWPFDEELWFGRLEDVRNEYKNLTKTIAQFEHVHMLLCHEEAKTSAFKKLESEKNITFHSVSLNDIWFRDNGPTFVQNPQTSEVSLVKWQFNAWGGKFDWDLDNLAAYQIVKTYPLNFFEANIVMEGGALEVNGQGVCLTTRQCLMSANRNPKLTEKDIELALKNYLGIHTIIWLENGLEGDHTDGHIDTLIRFANESTILYSICDDKDDMNFATTQHNYEILKNSKDQNGNPFTLIPLVLPKNKYLQNGNRVPATYANFYIGNGFVVVPLYDDPNDSVALNTIKKAFPNHKVIGLNSKNLILGGGSFHCLTQQEPYGPLWRN